MNNVFQLPINNAITAAKFEYEDAYDAYARAVHRYLSLTGNLHLMKHYLPFEDLGTKENEE